MPLSVSMATVTATASIYFTLDGTVPTTNSLMYSSPVQVVGATVLRAIAVAPGYVSSDPSLAYYFPAPPANNAVFGRTVTNSIHGFLVTLTFTPGTNAICSTLTETLAPGFRAIYVTNAIYLSGENQVLGGVFWSNAVQVVSYEAVGPGGGTFSAQASWSIDGASDSEAAAFSATFPAPPAPPVPVPPSQTPAPVLSPAVGSGLPVVVNISEAQPLAQVFYTTNGTVPNLFSMRYNPAEPLTFYAPTVLRAVAFATNEMPSESVLGYYVAAPPPVLLQLARRVSGDGSDAPLVNINVHVQAGVECYTVTEIIPLGLRASAINQDGVFDPRSSSIKWGPFLDGRPRRLSYALAGWEGVYGLEGHGSFDGQGVDTGGTNAVTINQGYLGASEQLLACVTGPFSYGPNLNPGPGIVVTNAFGWVDFGDGTSNSFAGGAALLPKLYAAVGNYTITLSASWAGTNAEGQPVFGHGNRSDAVQVTAECNPPIIGAQPQSQTNVAGATATLLVGATSKFPMTNVWFFAGQPVVTNTSGMALVLPNLTTANAGPFFAVVGNAFGAVTSQVATLSILVPYPVSAPNWANGILSFGVQGPPGGTGDLLVTTNLAPPVVWQTVVPGFTFDQNGSFEFSTVTSGGITEAYYLAVVPSQ